MLVDAGLYPHLRAKANGETSRHWLYRAQVAGSRRWLFGGASPEVGLPRRRPKLFKHSTTHEAAKKGEADHPVLVARFERKVRKEQATVADVFMNGSPTSAWSKRKGGALVRESARSRCWTTARGRYQGPHW